MIRGLYSAATGMLAQQAVQDALASNLANVNTTGFKQDVPTFRALHEMALERLGGADGGSLVGDLGLGTRFDRAVTDFSPGPLAATRNPLDLALVGDGFFAVETSLGERYTRDGAFHVEPAGKDAAGRPITHLADSQGRRVLGLKGPISTGGSLDVGVDEQGNVLVSGAIVDKLRIVSAAPRMLAKEGSNLYAILGVPAVSEATVRSGFLEQSNVNAISAMVRMIQVQRAYEAAQRAVTSQDDELSKVITEAGKV